METKVIKIDLKKDMDQIDCGARLIRQGELVAFPTETVYGLGADGLNPQAIKKIFQAKGRPSDNPLILHIADFEDLDSLVLELTESAKICMETFWPGPLTMVLKRSKLVPDAITAGLDTVAIRMPDNEIARELIRRAKRPIAAPSANTSGKPSPTRASHVYDDLEGKLGLILDGGSTGLGLESTVLDLTEKVPVILRPGGITYEDLKEVFNEVLIDESIIKLGENIVPRSPGQKYKHYAPEGEMFIFQGDLDRVIEEISFRAREYTREGKKVGIMCMEENLPKYEGLATVKSLGSLDNKEEIAHNLFHILRRFDDLGMDIILAEAITYTDMGLAIMNRMSKAASGRIIKL